MSDSLLLFCLEKTYIIELAVLSYFAGEKTLNLTLWVLVSKYVVNDILTNWHLCCTDYIVLICKEVINNE